MAIKTVNLTQASREWAFRPKDERFGSLSALLAHTSAAAARSREVTEHLNKSRVVVGEDGDLRLATAYEGEMKFSHWGFQQFCGSVGSRVQYMRDLANDPDRAAYNLNEDIARASTKLNGANMRNTLYIAGSQDADQMLLSCTTQKYGRAFNHTVVDEIMKSGDGFHTLPAMPAGKNSTGTRIATAEDCSRSSLIKPGMEIEAINPGLYAAPNGENMFIFMVDDNLRVDDGSDGGLSLGFFAVNSEVGQRAFELTTFMYRYVCGNHIVWEAEGVRSVKIKHIGDNVEDRIRKAIQGYLKSTRKTDLRKVETRVSRAKQILLGGTKDEVSDAVFARKELGLRRRDIDSAFVAAEAFADVDGSPRSLWGFAQGLTRASQVAQYADERNRMDMAASGLLQMADA